MTRHRRIGGADPTPRSPAPIHPTARWRSQIHTRVACTWGGRGRLGTDDTTTDTRTYVRGTYVQVCGLRERQECIGSAGSTAQHP